jgi:hypothetical protein
MCQRVKLALLLCLVAGVAAAQEQPRRAGREAARERRGPMRPYAAPQQAWGVATVILGAPTDRSVSMTVTPATELEGFVEYVDAAATAVTNRTPTCRFAAGEPVLVTITNLAPNSSYWYHLRYQKAGETGFLMGPAWTFRTQRAPGSTFVFEVQGDSHPERSPRQNVPALYEQTLLAVARDRPDFYLCMGDDFSVDTLAEITPATVNAVYRRQLPYLGLVVNSSALFLVNGNHEQAARYNLDGTPNNVAVLAQNTRNRLYPMPAPDGFYTGDAENVPHIGALRDYYAWTWGDALFAVIDLYWHSQVPVDNPFNGGPKNGDLWQVSLGDAQYKWLKTTLQTSQAKYKFIFTHHVLGTGRGGIENAGMYEWGGRSRAGAWEFDQRRPGWELPIHQLMATNGVTIFFQGHDHLFAHQQLDGVVYQTLPDPANTGTQMPDWASAYRSGDVQPSSGRLRVTVAPEKVRVEYVRSRLPQDATPEHPDGEVSFAYDMPAKGGGK